MGGFGGRQAQAPTLDVGKSLELSQGQIDQLVRNIPGFSQAVNSAALGQSAQGTLFGLNMLTRPDETIKREALSGLRATKTNELKAAQSALQNNVISKQEYDKRVAGINSKFAREEARVAKINPLSELQRTFAPEFKRRDDLLSSINNAQATTPEYRRAQQAMGRGIRAQTVGQRTAATSRAQAAGMGQVDDVNAQQVGAGQLGDTLMGRAMNMARSDGTLSAEANRDAVQAARAGMAARGMTTGSAALGAELLNRDRFARQRMFQDLEFAQGIQGQDLERQLANAGNVLRADMSNQQTQFGREQILSGNQQQTNLANMQAANQMAQFNTTLGADTDRFNAGQRDATNRFNIGLLGQSATMADAERARRLGLQQDAYNFSLSTNPRMMLAGAGQPYANLQTPGLTQLGGIVGSVTPQYSGGQFSSGNQGMNMLAGGLGGGLSGAAMGFQVGGPWGAGIGGALGLGAGLLGSAR